LPETDAYDPPWSTPGRVILFGAGSAFAIFNEKTFLTFSRVNKPASKDSKMALTVHHLNNSRSQRILWLLEELEIPYTIHHHQRDAVTNLAPPELLAIHPLVHPGAGHSFWGRVSICYL
jgi:hypothetical protein